MIPERYYPPRPAPIREAMLQAIQNGERFFFTGVPCRRGHIAKRSVSDGGCADCVKDNDLKQNYGITLQQFKEMEQAQQYLCAICKQERPLFVDHCHKSGKVRSLLCNSCNITVGHVENDSILDGLIKYFEIHPTQEVLEL